MNKLMNVGTRFMSMRFMSLCVPVLLLAGIQVAGTAQAQDAQGGCPMLPANTGLTWEYQNIGDADFCRALRADGSEAFGMFISKDPAFEPRRSNRAEEGLIDGHKVTWYRSELAGRPDVIARETLVEIDRKRTAHIWVQVNSEDQLMEAFRQASNLQFNGERQLSSN